MAEYISREAAEAIFAYKKENWKDYEAAACIAALSSADVAPVRHGRWELDVLDGTPGYRPVCIVCSECHRINYGLTPYCPNCGAKMDM